MRRVLGLLLTGLIVPASAFSQTPAVQVAAPSTFACFSPQQAFADSADGKAALARLTALQSERKKAIDERNQALQSRQRLLEQNAGVLSETARAQRTTELEQFRLDVQRFIEDAQAELMGVQKDAENAFLVKLRPVVEKVARDKGFQIIFNLDAGQIAWFDRGLDITPEIVRQLATP